MARSQPPTATTMARERTVLAWNRSALAAVVTIAVLLRHVWPLRGSGQELALGLIAAAAIIWSVVLLLFVASGADSSMHVMRGPRVFYAMTAATVVLAVAAVVLAFLSPP